MAYTSNILKGDSCKTQGGVKQVYFISHEELVFLPQFNASGRITALATVFDQPVLLARFDVDINTSTADETYEFDASLGTYGVSQAINLTTSGITQEKLATMQEFINQCAIIVHYHSGVSKLFGIDNWLDCDGFEILNGGGLNDAPKATMSFDGEEFEYAKEIEGATIDAPLGTLTQYTLIPD